MPDDRGEVLEGLVASGGTAQRVEVLASVVLGAALGQSSNSVAQELGVTRLTILRRRDRYRRTGADGLLKDAPRPERRKKLCAEGGSD